MNNKSLAMSINISRIDTKVGTFRVNAKMTKILSITSIEILGTDGWEALIIDINAPWYQTVLKACERHIQQQHQQHQQQQ